MTQTSTPDPSIANANLDAAEGSASQLSPETIAYLASRPKSERKEIGQFITPRLLRERLVANVLLRPGDRVLDPGVGTGEFLRTCQETCPDVELVGWDIDDQALAVARKLVPAADLRLTSALDAPWNPEFDVVIGNPPYYEIRQMDKAAKARFASVISGRPNIFALFFAVGFGVLKDGGYLAYVVPPSMNNGAYFSALRKHISASGSIEYLEVFEDNRLFEEAQTAVQLIVMKKGGRSTDFMVDLADLSGSRKHRVLFSDQTDQLCRQYEHRSTLWHLGYEAVTGSVVWNQHREKLRRSPGEGHTALLWAHNINADPQVVLMEDHPKRPQFIANREPLRGPAIVVNRITGTVGSGSLRCALVPEGMEFVGENHVNVILPRKEASQLVDWEELLQLLRHEGINGRVGLLTGNTQLSASELTYWLPLDTAVAARTE